MVQFVQNSFRNPSLSVVFMAAVRVTLQFTVITLTLSEITSFKID